MAPAPTATVRRCLCAAAEMQSECAAGESGADRQLVGSQWKKFKSEVCGSIPRRFGLRPPGSGRRRRRPTHFGFFMCSAPQKITMLTSAGAKRRISVALAICRSTRSATPCNCNAVSYQRSALRGRCGNVHACPQKRPWMTLPKPTSARRLVRPQRISHGISGTNSGHVRCDCPNALARPLARYAS